MDSGMTFVNTSSSRCGAMKESELEHNFPAGKLWEEEVECKTFIGSFRKSLRVQKCLSKNACLCYVCGLSSYGAPLWRSHKIYLVVAIVQRRLNRFLSLL